MVEKFMSLDLGTNVCHSSIQKVPVSLNFDEPLKRYCVNIYDMLESMNHNRLLTTDISIDDLFDYYSSLIGLRIAQMNNTLKMPIHQINRLVCHSSMAFVIENLGVDRNFKDGVIITITNEVSYSDINRLITISNKLSMFEQDGVILVNKLFSRYTEGDFPMMRFVVYDGWIVSLTHNLAPVYSYISAFIGVTLENMDLLPLYRYRYDDVQYVLVSLEGKEVIC